MQLARSLASSAALTLGLLAQAPLSPALLPYVKVHAANIALTHVRVIDGTGAAARDDQTVLLSGDRIAAIGSALPLPAGTHQLDLSGRTVFPGLVGMHDHLFYPTGGGSGIYAELGFSAPKLYLAGGVTSLRTTGSIEPYTDLRLKQLIDAGAMPGPHLHVTGPYLEGAGAFTPQMHELRDAADARATVAFWADQGATSFKAYMHITRAELAAAIAEAHRRGLKVTGHLCSIGAVEAAELGIDDLEHGLVVDTEFDPGKAPDVCPAQPVTVATVGKLDVDGPQIQHTIQELVRHHVAVTSTLPVFETFTPNPPPLAARVLASMTPEARLEYLATRMRLSAVKDSPYPAALANEMRYERAFVKAGGLLLAGLDPTGYGGVVPGYGDQREVELLVDAGFTPLEALRIASANGAQFLGESDQIGTLAPGKRADLVVVRGNPAQKISDIENVELVFKDGVGYDPAKLEAAAAGSVGLH